MTDNKNSGADKRVGSSDVLERELADLNAAVDEFAAAMKAKLNAKAREGWTGWRSAAYDGMIVSQLISKSNRVEYDRKQAVDIANLSLMLWYQTERSNTLIRGASHEPK